MAKIEWIHRKLYNWALKQDYVSLTNRYTCVECGSDVWFHPLIGAALMWCEDCGVLAVQKLARGEGRAVNRMPEQMMDEFYGRDGDRG